MRTSVAHKRKLFPAEDDRETDLALRRIGSGSGSVGLYCVTAYWVERRTGEIGVRMALGADRLSVLRLVLRGAFLEVGIELAIGIPATILGGRAMAAQLFGVTPYDPKILLGTTAVLCLAALVAALVPARRAASLDPLRALRTD